MRVRLIMLCVLFASLAMSAGAQDQGQASPPAANGTQAPGTPPKPMRIRVGGSVAAAKLIHQVQPIYPADAKAAHVQGTVLLHVIIAKDGSMEKVEIVSGPPMLLQAAKDAVERWRYQPTTLNGEPLEVDSTVQVVFTLGDSNDASSDQSGAAGNGGDAQSSSTDADSNPIDPQLKADILQLFDVMGMKTKAADIGHALLPTIRPVLIASLPPTPHRDQIVDAYGDRLFAIFSSQEFLDRSVALYAKYFSDADIKALTEFYRSPAGQRFNEVQSTLTGEGSQIGQDMALKALPGILKSLCHDYPELQGAANFCPSETKEKKSLLIAPYAGTASSAGGN